MREGSLYVRPQPSKRASGDSDATRQTRRTTQTPHGMLALVTTAVLAFRIIATGLTTSECSSALAAVSEATGETFELIEAEGCRRSLLLEGFSNANEDEWLIHHVMEALDETARGSGEASFPSSPVFVDAVPALRDASVETIVKGLVEQRIEEYGLRQPITCAASNWDVKEARPVINALIDGATIDGRRDCSAVVALDGVVDEPLRASLLSLLHSPGWDPEAGADPTCWGSGLFRDTLVDESGLSSDHADPAVASVGAGVGLREERLFALCAEPPEGTTPAPIEELQARLTALFEAANQGSAGVDVCRMPPAVLGPCVTPLAANAPIAADGDACYHYHIDADPALLPPSPFTDVFGRYTNRAPGKPRFVTALIYLSPEWRSRWGAPTRMLDPPTGQVLTVEPAPGRVCIMDQDISHSVTAPSVEAGDRPRYSLVLKLILHPRSNGDVPQIAIHDWGDATAIGSAT